MLRCDVCSAEVPEGEDACPVGHALLDPMLVLPTGDPAPGENGRIKLRAAEDAGAAFSAQFMSEALSALADAQAPVATGQDVAVQEVAVQEVAVQDVAVQDVASSSVGPVDHEDPESGQMDALLEQVEPPAQEPMVYEAPALKVGTATPPAAAELFGKPSGVRPRGRRGLFVPLVGLIVLAVIATVVFRPGAADAAVYRFAFTKGDTHRYSFRLSMDGEIRTQGLNQPMKLTMSMDMTERVVGVDPAGIATIRERIDRGVVRVAGESTTIPRTTVTMKLGPDGTIVGVQGAAGLGCSDADPSTQLIGPGQMYPAFPSDAIAPGDEWTIRQRFPDPFGSGDALSVTTHNRLVRLGDDGLALIRSDMTMPLDWDVSMSDVARAVGRACGASGGRDLSTLPDTGSFLYQGQIRMRLTQTIDRATGRPVSVIGSGVMDLTMAVDGFGQDMQVAMDMNFDVSFNERTGPTGDGGAREGTARA